jgi:EAL and modified HD-GYP domain-containing signal transduction protein
MQAVSLPMNRADRRSETAAPAIARARMTTVISPSQSNAAIEKTSRPSDGVAPHRFLSRQPVVHANGHLFGYELFFRAGETDAFSGDPELATREVIDHWLMLIPETAPCNAFVSCTRAALLDGLLTLLPAESTVFEISATLDPDPDLLEACLALKNRGYRFALDHFVAHPSRALWLELADFLKIDFLAADFQTRQAIYAMASRSPAQRIAVKIESECQMRIALSEGCSLFQGYFFSQPTTVSSRAVPQNHHVYLRLLAALNESPSDLRKIEKLISADAALCYRVLRLSNSALQGHPGTIATVREALLMVGDDAIRRLVTVAIAGACAACRFPALISMALSRARFSELLAPSLAGDPAQFYLLGILSLLDVLLETPLSRILQTLPISPAMKAALEGDRSPLGQVLELARSLESADWRRCRELQDALGLQEDFIASSYLASLRWASTMMAHE